MQQRFCSGLLWRLAAGFGRLRCVRAMGTMSLPSDHYLEIRLASTQDPFDREVNEIIDVRTPKEYEEDHIPGAINLPVLTNEERHIVGEEYASNSFEARRNGAAIISSNISAIIKEHFMDKPKSHSVMIYCWRGGQRSKSLSLVLNMIGYNVKHLSGGYKTYRSHVVSRLTTLPSQFSYKVVYGMTGCGKTLLLQQLKDAGEQILDLEALANHKGSVLGINYESGHQPSTKMFESRLLETFMTFDPALPVWVEAEGRKIGNLHITNSVFGQITKNVTDSYILQSSIETRVKFTMKEYEYFTKNTAELKESLERLSKFNAPLKKWYRLIDEEKFDDFVFDILKNHYDPMYKNSHAKSFGKNIRPEQRIAIHLERIDKEYFNDILPKLLSTCRAKVLSSNS